MDTLDIEIEGKKYTLKANGYFMKKYHDLFKGNVIIDTYLATERKDMLLMAQLTYCAIETIDQSFDEWISSFKSPFFLLNSFNDIQNFLYQGIEPTVKYKGVSKEESKKNL